MGGKIPFTLKCTTEYAHRKAIHVNAVDVHVEGIPSVAPWNELKEGVGHEIFGQHFEF